jgi:protein-disulfide isomerase
MNRLFFKKSVLTLASLAVLAAGCAPSSKQLKEAIEKDPSIVFAAIEKAPIKFIEVVNKAARDAQEQSAKNAQEEETKKRDDEFKNPLQPKIDEKRIVKGPKNAKVTIVEYSDFECPYCVRGYNTIKEVVKAYPNDVRVIYKHLPLDFHPKALPAAKYYEAIGRQSMDKAGKFHDAIFENQNGLKTKGEDFLKETAKKVGADMGKLEKDLKDESLLALISEDTEEAQKFGISGTPGFIINGVSLKGAYPFSEFKVIIDKHLGKN